ncbi:hypothetical protein ACX3UO_00045 [Corynebacterium coyleae]
MGIMFPSLTVEVADRALQRVYRRPRDHSAGRAAVREIPERI